MGREGCYSEWPRLVDEIDSPDGKGGCYSEQPRLGVEKRDLEVARLGGVGVCVSSFLLSSFSSFHIYT